MLKDIKNLAIIVSCASVILISIGGILPIITYGQSLDNPASQVTPSASQSPLNGGNNTKCNCVVFRLDDVQGKWIDDAQIAPMDLFISKNQSLSLGLIMNSVGNSSKVIDKVQEGDQSGLFELDLHGWDHVDYSNLTEQEQKDSLLKANEKMENLFGYRSDIFITPFNVFNNDTTKAMSELGLKILSADVHAESILNQNKSIFIADGKNLNNTANQIVYHLPGTGKYTHYENGTWIKTPINEILAGVDKDIAKFGYAVIVMHPPDFAKLDKNKKPINLVELNEVKDLSNLIDTLISKNIRITTFSKIVGIKPYLPASP